MPLDRSVVLAALRDDIPIRAHAACHDQTWDLDDLCRQRPRHHGAGFRPMIDVQERLRRHVEAMAACTEWTAKAQAALRADNPKLAAAHLKKAESYLRTAKALEA